MLLKFVAVVKPKQDWRRVEQMHIPSAPPPWAGYDLRRMNLDVALLYYLLQKYNFETLFAT